MPDRERGNAQARERMRRYRRRQAETGAQEADILQQRVAHYADQLLREHPEAARILAEVPYDLAAPLVDELKERLRGEKSPKEQ